MSIKTAFRELAVTLPLGLMLIAGVALPSAVEAPQFGTLPSQAEVDARAAADAVTEQKVALLTLGRDCWDPSTTRTAVPADVVVRDTSGAVTLLPFNQDTWDRAVAGEFVTLLACA